MDLRPDADPAIWTTFRVRAVNAASHADNPIHTDAGARAAGFPSALVAGVTTYAYLTHPLMEGWGRAWLERGRTSVRFRAPVFAGDEVVCTPTPQGAETVVRASVGDDDHARVEAVASLADPSSAREAPDLRAGEMLRPTPLLLEGIRGDRYGEEVGDSYDVFTRLGIVHPAVWPSLANHVVHRQVARGQWIHTRSLVRHHAVVPVGTEVEVRASVIERFERGGERAVLDVRIDADDGPVASLEHEAIVALPGA